MWTRVLLALSLLVVVLVVVAVAAAFWYWWPDLEVTIENRTSSALPQLTLVCNGTLRTPVPSVPPGSSATVQPRMGEGENTLLLIDAGGRQYEVLCYVEGDPGGSVSIIVTHQSEGALGGSVIDECHYFPSGEFALEPIGR